MTKKSFSVLALLVLSACAPSVPLFLSSPPVAQSLMDVTECKAAEVCTIQGQVSVIKSNGVAMGELRQGDGECITLSLSKNDVAYLERKGPVEATVSGRIYRGHHDPNSVLLKIEGREVGYPRCGEFYLFIPSDS